MSRKTIVRFVFVLALLIAAGLLARATNAKADTAPNPVVAPKAPSVVMEAFRQGQVIGSGQYRAALIVRYGDGGVQTRCVAFDEEEIGGDELITRSGMDFAVDDAGAVCSINGEGCPSDDCFCECPFPNCEYWAYYQWDGGSWIYSNVGPSFSKVRDGSIEGWSWGEGDFNQGVEPPVMAFDQICPSAQSQATPTVTSPASSSGAPYISFFTVQPTTVQSGACATLSWQVTNAVTVLLEGATVATQGTQQVCPSNTQTYTLIAASGSSQQTSQQVTVQVSLSSATGQATATPTATVAGAGAGTATTAAVFTTPDVVRSGMPTPAYITPQPIVTQPPQPITQPGAVAGLPSPDPNLSPLAGQQLVGGVPLAPTAEPASMEQLPQAPQGPLPTSTRFALARPPTETPRPRRILGDGRPTPTPILVARAGAAPGSGAATTQDRGASTTARDASSALVASRAFDDNLLPQYAAYLATLTVLLAMGWLVHRRRNAQPTAVAQAAPRAARERLGSGDERAAQ